jgi:hypothetical protein
MPTCDAGTNSQDPAGEGLARHLPIEFRSETFASLTLPSLHIQIEHTFYIPSSNDVVCWSFCKKPMDARLSAKSLTRRNMNHSRGVFTLLQYSDSSWSFLF